MLRNIWKEVKQSCPYFYKLKPLLGEQMLVTDHAIGNSINDVDTSSLMTKKIFAPTRTKLASEEKREKLTDGSGDTQSVEDGFNSDTSDVILAFFT